MFFYFVTYLFYIILIYFFFKSLIDLKLFPQFAQFPPPSVYKVFDLCLCVFLCFIVFIVWSTLCCTCLHEKCCINKVLIDWLDQIWLHLVKKIFPCIVQPTHLHFDVFYFIYWHVHTWRTCSLVCKMYKDCVHPPLFGSLIIQKLYVRLCSVNQPLIILRHWKYDTVSECWQGGCLATVIVA